MNLHNMRIGVVTRHVDSVRKSGLAAFVNSWTYSRIILKPYGSKVPPSGERKVRGIPLKIIRLHNRSIKGTAETQRQRKRISAGPDAQLLQPAPA